MKLIKVAILLCLVANTQGWDLYDIKSFFSSVGDAVADISLEGLEHRLAESLNEIAKNLKNIFLNVDHVVVLIIITVCVYFFFAVCSMIKISTRIICLTTLILLLAWWLWR